MKRILLVMLLCLLPLAALAENGFVTREELLAIGAADMPLDMPIAVKPGFEEAARDFLTENPDWPMEAVLEGLGDWLADSLTDGLTVKELDLHSQELILMLEQADGTRTLRIAAWNGKDYDIQENTHVPAGASLDTVNVMDGRAGLWYPVTAEKWTYAEFRRDISGRWGLASSNNGTAFHRSWAGISDSVFWLRDLRVGTYPWDDLRTMDIAAIPLDMDLALSYRNTDGWAVVNNPNPEDRLHLRAKPDKGAASLGKFYNGTPVRVLGAQGEWSHVRIGLDGLEGWMMTKYLASGSAMDGVASAYPELFFTDEEYDVPVHAVRREPKAQAPVAWELDRMIEWVLIGVSGDDWYILMDELGRVGYVPQAWYSAGNG